MASNRLGSISNLGSGGTYDLLMIKVDGEFPEGKVTFAFYDVPMKVTGLQKVAQVFIKTLLTTKGSDLFYPNKGTFFPLLTIGANINTDDPTFFSDLTETIKDASNQVRGMMNVNTADLSSTLDTVEVLGIDRVNEGIFIFLEMTTLDGKGASVALPFPEFGLG